MSGATKKNSVDEQGAKPKPNPFGSATVPSRTSNESVLTPSVKRRRHQDVIYLPTPSGRVKSLKTTPVSDCNDSQRLSRIDVEIDTPLSRVPLGRTAQLLSDDELQLTRKVDPSAFCPDWTAIDPRPQTGRSDARSVLHRFNGTQVRPKYVFGPDDRQVFASTVWPWGLVGKIETSGGWIGTGALIGDRTVVTAAHVVPWTSGPWWMKFTPAYNSVVMGPGGSSSLHGPGFSSFVSDARGSLFRGGGRPVGYDWAVLRLYEPLGADLGYFGYHEFHPSWTGDAVFNLVGYPFAAGGTEQPSRQFEVSAFDTDGDSRDGLEIETKADVTDGNSGGPFWGWHRGVDPRILGVVSGDEEDWDPGFWPWEWGEVERGNVVAGGKGFRKLCAWGRANWTL